MKLNQSLSIIGFCIGLLVIIGIIGNWGGIVSSIVAIEYVWLQIACLIVLAGALIGFGGLCYFLWTWVRK